MTVGSGWFLRSLAGGASPTVIDRRSKFVPREPVEDISGHADTWAAYLTDAMKVSIILPFWTALLTLGPPAWGRR